MRETPSPSAIPPSAGELRLEAVCRAMSSGRPVVVVDDGRAGQADLVLAAELAGPAQVAFLMRHSAGGVAVALPERESDRLGLFRIRLGPGSAAGYAVPVDVAAGTAGGLSAADRARTIRALADPASVAESFVRPGQVAPLRAAQAGVLARPGGAEAAIDLARMAGLRSAAVLSALVSHRRDGELACGPEPAEFAARHGLELISIAEVQARRRRTEPQVVRGPVVDLPTSLVRFRGVGYRGVLDGAEHIALLAGTVDDGLGVPVVIHRECPTGDALRSTGCDCARHLAEAVDTIAGTGRGVIVYVRRGGNTGRSAPFDMLHTDQPGDEVTPAGKAAIETAVQILADLGVGAVQLPRPIPEIHDVMATYGIRVELPARPTADAIR